MQLSPTDLKELTENRIPHAIRDVMRAHPHEVVLAGGFVRSVCDGVAAVDVDLFVPDKELALEVAKQIGADHIPSFSRWEVRHCCLCLPTTPWPTQVSWRRPFERPKEVASCFDFTVCMASLWSTGDGEWKWDSWVHDLFYPDLLNNHVLRYMDPVREEVGGEELLRVLKFVARGYKISLDDLAKVVDKVYQPIVDRIDQDSIYDVLRRSDSSSEGGGLPYFKQVRADGTVGGSEDES